MGERTAVTVDVVDVLIEVSALGSWQHRCLLPAALQVLTCCDGKQVCNTSGRGTYTVRRLVTGVLWNLAVLDFGLEIRMVEKVRIAD